MGSSKICYQRFHMKPLYDKAYFEQLARTRHLQSQQRKAAWLRIPLWIIPWVVFYVLWNVLLVTTDGNPPVKESY